jgi:hypothetical protein
MATNREIKAALGLRDGASGRQVENAAIRAWCVGGDDLLDSMEKVNRLASRLCERGIAGQDEANEALNQLRILRDVMLTFVRNKAVG